VEAATSELSSASLTNVNFAFNPIGIISFRTHQTSSNPLAGSTCSTRAFSRSVKTITMAMPSTCPMAASNRNTMMWHIPLLLSREKLREKMGGGGR
jgi:hypothetical protein